MTEMHDIPQPQSQPQEKIIYPYTVKDRIMAAAMLLLAMLFIYSAVEGAGILLWLFLSALLVATPFYLHHLGIKITRTAVLLFVLLFLFTLPRILFDSNDLYLLTYTVVLPGYMYVVHYVCAEYGANRLPGEAFVLDAGKAIFAMPFSRFSAMQEALFQKRRTGFGRTLGYILLGLLLAAVPTLIVLVLLIQSDNSFSRLLDDIFFAIPKFDLSTFFVSFIVGIKTVIAIKIGKTRIVKT